jgi:hypothetical protein
MHAKALESTTKGSKEKFGMKKRGLLIFATVLGSILLIVSVHSQEDMVVVNDDVFENPQRPPAVFNHDEHNEIAEIEECNQCHHIYEDGELVEDESSEDQSCSDCHAENDSGEKPGLTKAFHRNCKGCHLENKKGPIMSGQCHVR